MIEIDWKKLKEEHPVVECINLSLDKPSAVKKGDFVTVIQHSQKGILFCSSSECFTIGKWNAYRNACMFAYATFGQFILIITVSHHH